jgi:hypothetical protein
VSKVRVRVSKVRVRVRVRIGVRVYFKCLPRGALGRPYQQP